MKLQLDTNKKTIKVEGDVVIEKLLKTLKELFPKNEWKKYTLQTNVTITGWTQPYIIPTYPVYPTYPRPYYPWWGISYTSGNATGNLTAGGSLKANAGMNVSSSGIYNVQA